MYIFPKKTEYFEYCSKISLFTYIELIFKYKYFDFSAKLNEFFS